MKIIKTAQAEISSIIAERKVTAELTKNILSAANRNYEPNDDVLIYDDQSQQWKGPYIEVDCNDRMVTVTDEDRV